MADVEVPFLIPTKCRDRRCRGSKTSHLDDVLQLQPFDGPGKSRVFFSALANQPSHYCV